MRVENHRNQRINQCSQSRLYLSTKIKGKIIHSVTYYYYPWVQIYYEDEVAINHCLKN